MKKILVILFVIVFIFGIFAGIYFYSQRQKMVMEEILPEGALIYARTSDVQENLQKITSSPFWQSIMGINYERLAEKKIITKAQKIFIQKLKNNLMDAAQNKEIQKFFGQELAVAVYPVEFDFDKLKNITDFLNPDLIEEMFSGLILSVRIRPEAQFAEFVSRAFDLSATDVSFKTEDYKGHVMRTLIIPETEIKINFTRIKDVLIFGVGQHTVRKVVDVFKGDESSLMEAPVFKQAQKKFMDPSDLEGYVDMAGVFSMIKKQITRLSVFMREKMDMKTSETVKKEEQLRQFLKKVEGVNVFSFSTQWEEVFQQKYDVFFDEEKLDGQMTNLYSCPGVENKTSRFIPEDVFVYQWSNCFKLDDYWKQINTQMDELSADQIKGIESMLEISVVGDILPAFGEEIGGYLQDVQFKDFPMIGEFPIPELVFFIKVKNRENVEKLLTKLTKNPFITLREEVYKDVSLHYASLPVGDDIQPGYCFLGKYLLISTNRALLKDSIEAYNNSVLSIVENDDFKLFALGGTKKYRSVQFVKMEKFIQNLRDVVEWATRRISQKDKNKLAFKTGSERRLADIKQNIKESKSILKATQEKIRSIEDEISESESKNLDFKEKKQALIKLKKNIHLKQQEILGAYASEQEQKEIIQGYRINMRDAELRQVYLNEIIYPVLNGFESIKAFGAKSTVEEGVMESRLLLR